MLLSDLLHGPVLSEPNEQALRVGKRTWTYRELEEITNRVATSLLAEGLRKGDRLTLLLPNCAELVFTYLACFKAGIIAVPLNYRYRPSQVDYGLQHSGSSALVAHAERLGDIAECDPSAEALRQVYVVAGEAPAGFRQFDRLLDRPAASHALPKLGHDDVVLIMYTSGTTAKPKGVMHSHRTVANMIRNQMAAMPLVHGDVSLVSLSIAHALGLLGQVLATLYAGGTIVLLEKFSPEAFFEAYAHHRPKTFIEMLPATLTELIRHPSAAKLGSHSLRFCICGGDKIPIETHRAFKELTGVEVTEACGMTEVFHYAMNPPFGRKKIGSIGLPMYATEIRIVDERENDLPVGAVGQILVQSNMMLVGYWNNPDETEKALRGGWMHTGDLGRYDEDGYLWFVGRMKDIIIRDGSNISPLEVENALYEHPAIASAGVVGEPHPVHGQTVRAFVKFDPKAESKPTETELIEHVRQRLAAYMAPERITFLETMPMNATGKLDRTRLREMAHVS